MTKRKSESKLDEAVSETFPASDPPAAGSPTGTEPAKRPADRKPPIITREQVEAAERDEGHRHLQDEGQRHAPDRAQTRREKHHGLGQDGLHEGDKSDATVVKHHGGLGRAGKRGAG